MADDRRIPATGGVELAVRVWAEGDGVPVLLVHGLASSKGLWQGVAEHLSAVGHPVATVDQRGHGLSDKPEHSYDFATITDDLIAVITALGFEQPVVAGQSWGGNVVIDLAFRHPGQVRAVVAVDGGTIELSRRFLEWDAAAQAMAPPDLTGLLRSRLEEGLRTQHPDWPETGIAGVLTCFEELTDGTVRPRLSRANHMKILRELWGHRPSTLYAGLKVPVLLIPADDGNTAWVADKRVAIEEAASAIPQVQVRWFEADHDVHAQHPAEVARAIHDFIGSVLPG
jgi:pimeloyl-ACP methyl ester carboxylesterase